MELTQESEHLNRLCCGSLTQAVRDNVVGLEVLPRKALRAFLFDGGDPYKDVNRCPWCGRALMKMFGPTEPLPPTQPVAASAPVVTSEPELSSKEEEEASKLIEMAKSLLEEKRAVEEPEKVQPEEEEMVMTFRAEEDSDPEEPTMQAEVSKARMEAIYKLREAQEELDKEESESKPRRGRKKNG